MSYGLAFCTNGKNIRIENVKFNNEVCFKYLQKCIIENTIAANLYTYFGITGSTRNPWRSCLFIDCKLPSTPRDFFLYSNNNVLTNIGLKYINEISFFFEKVCTLNNVTFEDLSIKPSLIEKLKRESENLFRSSAGIAEIGEGFINETYLSKLILDFI